MRLSRTINLARNEVHIWQADLDVPPFELSLLQRVLSPDEMERAQRFLFERHRRRFIVARGLLRIVLSHYLSCDPNELQFCYGPNGKPALAQGAPEDIRFNLSHCQNVALYAIARGHDVGIDIENIRPELAEEQIAEQFFSPIETASIRALARELQPHAFFACWTRKEAYVKARGAGLSMSLNHFDVSVNPQEPPRLLRCIEPDEVSRWSLFHLAPGAGYVAALAIETQDCQLKFSHWPETSSFSC
jgi:4'-phosphopantetheinyl transferase